MKAWMTAAIAATALAAGAAYAGDVSWTITVGSPRPAPRVIYAPPPVVLAPPPVVYHPAPVVYQPAYQPIYQPVRVVYAQPVYRIPPGHAKHWQKHGHRYPGAVVYAQPRGRYYD